jgi:hypothetical protein
MYFVISGKYCLNSGLIGTFGKISKKEIVIQAFRKRILIHTVPSIGTLTPPGPEAIFKFFHELHIRFRLLNVLQFQMFKC